MRGKMRKPRVLYVGEFSRLNTGYATISFNLLHELHKSGKYELAELAGYCKGSEPLHQQMIRQLPWKVYPNLPEGPQEEEFYNSQPTNEFGKWRFEQVCLDFQPDIVWSIRDFWMDNFIDQSPFRRFYKTVMMPTVDAEHQHSEWIDLYKRTDHILAYTKFGYDVLQEEGGGLIPLRGIATPCVNTEIYKPVQNKKQHKANFGLPSDSIIIGMVARNQRRKLYPDFGQAFAEFVEQAGFKDTNNVYLYWHTSHPDVGWDLPEYIKSHGLSRKVFLTYFCQSCGNWFPSLYQDAATICQRCGQKSAVLSNSNQGIDQQALASVYNFMDLYVQFVSNEGLGIPMMEAAACGVPICGTYYSGTQDLIDNLSGHPIPPRTLFVEAETTRKLSMPSVDALVEYIHKFTSLPESIRAKLGYTTAELTRKCYGGWSSVADNWMDIFDSIKIEEQNQWTAPPELINTGTAQMFGHDKMSDEQYVQYILADVIRRPDWVNAYMGIKILRDLSWGRTVANNLGFFLGEQSQLGGKPRYEPFNREKLLQYAVNLRNIFNEAEQARAQYISQGKIR